MSTINRMKRSTAIIATFAAGMVVLAATGHANAKDGNDGNGRQGQSGNANGTTASSAAKTTPTYTCWACRFVKRDSGDKLERKPDSGRDMPGRDMSARDKSDHKMPRAGGKPVETTGGKPTQPSASNSGTPATAKPVPVATPAPGTVGTNNRNPARPSSGAQTTTGRLPPNDPVGNTHPTHGPGPAGGDVTVSNGVTTTILHGASSGVLVQSLEPGKITVRGDNGQSVTLPGGSVNVTGAAIVGSGVAIERINHPNGDVTLAVGPGITYPAPATPPAPAPTAGGTLNGSPNGPVVRDHRPGGNAAPKPTVSGTVTGGPEGGFFGALGSSILDAGKAIVEAPFNLGGPTPGTPGAVDRSQPKTSTTTQQ